MSITIPASLSLRPNLLANNERRIDGVEKVTGQAQYTADFSMPGMLWAAFVPGTLPYAKIVRIDTSKALALKGVHAVLTGADIGERFLGRRLFDWPVLAYEKVRFVGEYVAGVAADTPEIAQAAADLIEVEYEELEPLYDPRHALTEHAHVLHPDRAKFPYLPPKSPDVPHPNMQGYDDVRKGDVSAGFASATRVFTHTYETPRYHAGYIEPRGTLVWIDADGTVHVISTNKGPFSLQDQLAVTTGLPKEKIVVEPSFIGGEFGAKGLSIEEFPCYYLAKATGRPVKYVRTHLDDVRSTNVRHAAYVTVSIGVDATEKIVALEVNALFDGGAYAAGKVIPTILPGAVPKLPYAIPNVRIERTAVYTNTVPGGFVRAPGDFQILFALESQIDVVARELGLDPLEFRLRNAMRDGDTDIEGSPILEPRAREVIERLREASGWGEALAPGRGRGMAVTGRHIGGGKTSVALTACVDGDVQMDVGVPEPGVGTLTVVQRVLASELGIAESRVHVTRGATNAVPFDPGIGGSRSTNIVGHATLDAARKLRAALESVAADLVEKPQSTMELRDSIFVAYDGSARIAWDDVMAAYASRLPERIIGHCNAMHAHGEPEWNNFAGYVVEVSVDAETGQPTIHQVTHVVDVGTIINPIAHRGQIDGGFLMGLGHAMSEELVVQDGRIVNLSLGEYKLPTQMDMPPFEVIYLDPTGGPGPFGAKASGELNTAGIAPAIANAIAACGVRLDQLPLTAERIYEKLHPTVEG